MKNYLLALIGSTTLLAASHVEAKTILFSGYNWTIKNSAGKVGPGSNYFSDSSNNVWVDTQGRLHLKITKQGGRWYCAEVVSQSSFGYGTYRFYLDSAVENLDKNAVLGLFTWSDDPAWHNREIDFEASRWGQANNLNAQYVVQPYTNPQNIVRFNIPPGSIQTIHSFNWQSTSVSFLSVKGTNPAPTNQSDIIQQWTNTGSDVPQAGGENARMNLWLFNGTKPSNGQSVEVIVSKFEFVPGP